MITRKGYVIIATNKVDKAVALGTVSTEKEYMDILEKEGPALKFAVVYPLPKTEDDVKVIKFEH